MMSEREEDRERERESELICTYGANYNKYVYIYIYIFEYILMVRMVRMTHQSESGIWGLDPKDSAIHVSVYHTHAF